MWYDRQKRELWEEKYKSLVNQITELKKKNKKAVNIKKQALNSDKKNQHKE